MAFLRRIGIMLAWIFGAFVLVIVGGMLLNAVGKTAAIIVGSAAFICWLAGLFFYKSNAVAGISFFSMGAAGFALWLTEN